MGHRRMDGIVIDTYIDSKEEEEVGIPIYLRVIQLLVIVFGCWSFLSILMESFLIPVSIDHVNIALVISSIVFFLFFLFPSYGVVKTFITILFYGLFCYSRVSQIQNAFYILENLIIKQINNYYETQILYYTADYSSVETDTTLFLILLVIPVAALIASAIVSKRVHNIAFVVLVLPVIASFAIGMIPSEGYLIITLLVLVFLSKVHGMEHFRGGKLQMQIHTKVGMKVATLLCAISLLLFFLLKLFVSPAEYESIQEVKTAKSKIQTFLFDFSLEDVATSFGKLKFANTKIAPGGLSGGRLGRVDQVSFTDTEHLRITVPLPSAYEGIYLKGYVGSIYTGDSWEESNEASERKYQALQETIPLKNFAPVNQVSLLFEQMMALNMGREYQFFEGKIKVEYEEANRNYLYIPYFAKHKSMETIAYKQDLYAVPLVKRENYVLDYYFNVTFGNQSSSFFDTDLSEKLADYSEYEKRYREYVYDVYTQLPEEGIDRLKKDFSLENFDEEFEAIPDKIMYIKDYLNQNTQYSLSPGKLPKDKDFVEYFLYDNQVGYCAHYASSATLMLRVMGVPARYVEGYAVGKKEIDQSDYLEDQMITGYSSMTNFSYGVRQLELSVRDYNAHAWVEIYMDGCGWMPVEFTPGSATEYADAMIVGMAQIGEEINQYEESNVPTITPQAPTPTPKEQEDDDEEGIAKPTIAPEQGNTERKGEAGARRSERKSGLWFLMATLGAVLGLGGAGIVVFIYRKKNRMRRSNRNQKALLLYKEFEKIICSRRSLMKQRERLEDHLDDWKKNCPYLNEDEFDICIEIIEKARFGRNGVSAIELRRVIRFYEELFETTYENASFCRKVFLKLQRLL